MLGKALSISKFRDIQCFLIFKIFHETNNSMKLHN